LLWRIKAPIAVLLCIAPWAASRNIAAARFLVFLGLELSTLPPGRDFRGLLARQMGAVLFAPSGGLVPPTSEALDRGGVCSIAGIHPSDVPSLNYSRHLYQERELRSVTSNTHKIQICTTF
jgi:hypothetical protein